MTLLASVVCLVRAQPWLVIAHGGLDRNAGGVHGHGAGGADVHSADARVERPLPAGHQVGDDIPTRAGHAEKRARPPSFSGSFLFPPAVEEQRTARGGREVVDADQSDSPDPLPF